MGAIDAVKKGFSLAKSNVRLAFVLILLYLVYFAINFGLNAVSGLPAQPQDPATLPPGQLLRQILIGLAISLIGLIIQNYIQGGLVAHVGETLKKGKQEIGVFFSSAKKFALRLFLQAVLIMLIFFVLFAIAVVIMGVLGAAMQIAGIIVGVALMALVIYLSLLLFYSSYILVLEDQSIVESMKRSITFVRKNLVPFLGIILTFVACFLVPFGVLLAILWLIQGPLQGGVGAVVLSVVGLPLFILILAFYGIAVTGAVVSFYLSRSGQSVS